MSDSRRNMATPKCPYTRPELRNFGNLTAVTNNVGNMGATSDNGTPPNQKTS